MKKNKDKYQEKIKIEKSHKFMDAVRAALNTKPIKPKKKKP